MARIKTYPIDKLITDKDKLVGSDINESNKTKTFTVLGLKEHINQDNNLQSILDNGNSATNDITLVGNIKSTLIEPENIIDENFNIGSTGQILVKTNTGVSWEDPIVPNEVIGATVITGDNYIIELEKLNGDVIPIEFSQSFRYIQSLNSNTWTIIHNLGFKPSVTIIDLDGDVVNGDIAYNTNNQLTLTFAQPIKGEAYLN